MDKWQVIEAADEIRYHEQEKEFEFSCSVPILAWDNLENYVSDELENWKKHNIVAEVVGEIKYGQKKVDVIYLDEEVKCNMIARKAIKEAEAIILTELTFIIDDYYS